MIEEKQLDIDGCPVRLLKAGTEEPVLLFLHGWGCNASTMQSLATESITAAYRCIFIDFPGFGKTPPPPKAWGIDEYADFTAALIRKLSPEKPVSVVAHSFGGRVLLKLLAAPQTAGLVEKVVITGGAGMRPRRGISYYYKTTLARMLKAPFALLAAPQREKAHQWLRSTAVWKSLGSSEYKSLEGVMQRVFVKTVREYLEPCLPEIEHEVLLIWGEEDEATPLYQGQRMEKGLENGYLVSLPDAGHYAFLDQPARFRAVMHAYLIPQ
ncbi:MAG: alpha/beta fold hydrolase [Cyclonatronaceae bacterium]